MNGKELLKWLIAMDEAHDLTSHVLQQIEAAGLTEALLKQSEKPPVED